VGGSRGAELPQVKKLHIKSIKSQVTSYENNVKTLETNDKSCKII
jgi:hypothetical protein